MSNGLIVGRRQFIVNEGEQSPERDNSSASRQQGITSPSNNKWVPSPMAADLLGAHSVCGRQTEVTDNSVDQLPGNLLRAADVMLHGADAAVFSAACLGSSQGFFSISLFSWPSFTSCFRF